MAFRRIATEIQLQITNKRRMRLQLYLSTTLKTTNRLQMSNPEKDERHRKKVQKNI